MVRRRDRSRPLAQNRLVELTSLPVTLRIATDAAVAAAVRARRHRAHGPEWFPAVVALSRTPTPVAVRVADRDVPPLVVGGTILLIDLTPGCVMEALAMARRTLPVSKPVIQKLDLGRGGGKAWPGSAFVRSFP